MKNKLLLTALLVLAPATALHAMTVGTFLEKADALQKRGVTALFSADFRLLKSEVKGASEALRSERLAAQRAGRRAAYCPPDRPSLNSDEILAYFRSIPAPQRNRTEVRDALRGLLARKYPCAS
ncbi:hypothetical protein [Sphingosinicella terrae]|uniref:hypothetical protein n=1 Tax=Sphingosinicella terrae TaxID=2172047 RepID=UPI000E0D91FA|nr:hypothetical protein [Sphingosinicella terrae]